MSGFIAGSPLPVPDRDSEPFWSACQQRQLILRSCKACGRSHYPPVGVCPWCVSEELSWVPSAGLGHVRSFVVFHHAFIPALAESLPYTILKVALDDHPDAVLHGRLMGPRQKDVVVGTSVELDWDEIGEGFVLPNWKIADGA